MKGVIFVNGRYTKGVPFLSKMVHKRLRGSLDLGALGGHCGFQVTGMMEGFFWGLKFLILGFFLGSLIK